MTVYPGGPQDSITYELIAGDGLGTTNLAPAPSGEYGLLGWRTGGTALTLSQQVDSSNFARLGSYYLRYTGTPSSSSVFIGGVDEHTAGTYTVDVQPNTDYCWSLKIRATAGNPTYRWGFITSAGAWATGSPVATGIAIPTSSQGTIISGVDVTSPANAAGFGLEFVATTTSTTTVDLDGLIVHQGSLLSSYFDGDVPGCRWNGSNGLSSSTRGTRAVFNDPQDEDYVGMGYFAGLESAEIREAIDPRTGADGAIQGLNFRGSRPIVLNTEIVASTTTERNQRFQKLKRASNALRRDGALLYTPDGGLPMAAYVRKSGPIRRADERGWVYKVQLPLTAADPYLYSQSIRKSTQTVAPYQTTLTNQGDGYAPVRMEVSMSGAGTITLMNQSTGESINLNSIDPANIIQFVQKLGRSDYSGDPFQLYTFSNPFGVGIDASNNVYVADLGHNSVKEYTNAGVFIRYIGTGLSGSYSGGELVSPVDVAIDSSSNIYVVNQGVSRVSKWNSSAVWQADTSTTMNTPYACAIDSSNNVFVTDVGNYKLRKFASTLGAEAGNVGAQGTGNGQFATSYGPSGVAVDSANGVWVVDRGNKRVQKFTNATPPAYVSQFNTSQPDGTGQNPFGIAIDSSNNMYVSDISSSVIHKYNSSGVYQTQFGGAGTGQGQFQTPANLDCRGTNLWVPDFANNRIQQFSTASGGNVVVDTATATARGSTGLNLFQFVNTGATSWWALQPGDNVVSATGATITAVAYAFRDSWD